MSTDEIQLNDPQTLYERWEGAQWNPFTVPLEWDIEQWAGMGDRDRGLVYWVLSSLMVAEERITTKFSGLVGAHGSEEEASFLATQQVDEALLGVRPFAGETIGALSVSICHEPLPVPSSQRAVRAVARSPDPQ